MSIDDFAPHNDEPETEFDPRERPEERAEIEEFAKAVIGPDWQETTSRKELVDTWIMFGGDGWRMNVDFLRDMYHQLLAPEEKEGEEEIPEQELAALGACIEPTEALYETYRMFDEQACGELNVQYERHGFEPVFVHPYEEWMHIIADLKEHDPAKLYRQVCMWNTGYEEWSRQMRRDIEKTVNQTIEFYRRRGAKIDFAK